MEVGEFSSNWAEPLAKTLCQRTKRTENKELNNLDISGWITEIKRNFWYKNQQGKACTTIATKSSKAMQNARNKFQSSTYRGLESADLKASGLSIWGSIAEIMDYLSGGWVGGCWCDLDEVGPSGSSSGCPSWGSLVGCLVPLVSAVWFPWPTTTPHLVNVALCRNTAF